MTIQPSLGLRARSSTSPHRTNPKSRHPPLHLHLPTTALKASDYPEHLPSLAESPLEKPSAPIDIPSRTLAQGRLSVPTPLTARAPQGDYFTSWSRAEPRISDSLTPYYSSRTKNPSCNRDPSATPRGFTPMSSRSELSSYRPSSPFCSKMSAPLPSIDNGQKLKLPAQLPKYHPANFRSRVSSPSSPSLLSSRSAASQPRSGRASDAKQQLLQYQRDVLKSTAKISHSQLSSSVSSKPSPPRLNPLRSPAGPMTPFMLEGPSDYLAAGSSSLPITSKESDNGEFVERLVHRENERCHPEARSGSVSPVLCLSPAVSPAGGRG